MSAIDEAREAEARMTPGPWRWGEGGSADDNFFTLYAPGWKVLRIVPSSAGMTLGTDTAGIVAIRNAWPAAMAALDEARREVARLTAALTEARKVAEEAIGYAIDEMIPSCEGFARTEYRGRLEDLRARLAALEVPRG